MEVIYNVADWISAFNNEYQHIIRPIAYLFALWVAFRLCRWMMRRIASACNALMSRHAKQVGVSMATSLLPDLTNGVARELVEDLPLGISSEQERRISGLKELVKKLRFERDWVPVVVRIHGFESNYGVFQGSEIHAQVLLNPQTGQVKAHPDLRLEHAGSSYRIMPMLAYLGSPKWSRIPDEPHSIYMLGQVYRLHYGDKLIR